MLEPPRPAPPITIGSPDTTRIPEIPMPEFRRTVSAETTTPQRTGPTPAIGTAPTPAIAGPSLLGLDTTSESKPVNDTSIDLLRDRSFSGLDSFYQPEEKGVRGRQILLLLVLLAALGAAGWWTYKNYLGATTRPASPAATNSGAGAAADTASAKPATSAPASPDTSAPAAASPTASAQASPAAINPPQTSASSPAAPPAATSSAAEQKPSTPAAKHNEVTVSAAAPKPAVPKPAPVKTTRAETPAQQLTAAPGTNDNGDAAYRKAQALLYGQGGAAANCDEAVKYLKEASAKQNAKARSTFGTMYATGHCVPRDLPTSYSWFALALHVDPNNQILEKDLTAVWNQMTPPERQLATKMKP